MNVEIGAEAALFSEKEYINVKSRKNLFRFRENVTKAFFFSQKFSDILFP